MLVDRIKALEDYNQRVTRQLEDEKEKRGRSEQRIQQVVENQLKTEKDHIEYNKKLIESQ